MFLFCPFRAVLRPTSLRQPKKRVRMFAPSTISKTARISTSAWTPSTPIWRWPSNSLRRRLKAKLHRLPKPNSTLHPMASTTRWTATSKQRPHSHLPLCPLIIIIAQPLCGNFPQQSTPRGPKTHFCYSPASSYSSRPTKFISFKWKCAQIEKKKERKERKPNRKTNCQNLVLHLRETSNLEQFFSYL